MMVCLLIGLAMIFIGYLMIKKANEIGSKDIKYRGILMILSGVGVLFVVLTF